MTLRATHVVALLAALAAAPSLAAAQTIEIIAPSRGSIDANAPADNAQPETLAHPDARPDIDDETLARALTFDPAKITQKTPGRGFGRADGKAATVWSRTAPGSDGSSTLKVKTPITGSEWNAAIGGELAIAGTPPQGEFDRPLPGTVKDPRAGAAWGNVEVPDVATFEARVAPSDTERKASASVQRAVPIGRDLLSVGVENRITVIEPNQNGGLLPTTNGQYAWGNKRSVKFNVLPTGTTLTAAMTNASDPTLNNRTFGAEQKIYGPLRMTTSVTNPGQPNQSKSIGAGLKFDW